MLCVYFLLFYSVILGVSTQDYDDDVENKCIVPPKDIIKNGKFVFSGYDEDDQPPAGEKLYSYVMEVTCNPGFRLHGSYLVQCVSDKSMDPFPKCVAPCKRQSPDILSCGIGFDNEESQCIQLQKEDSLTTRSSKDLQCGVIPTIFRTTVANGTEAKPEDAPWHAGIYTKTTKPYMQICGGTIISRNVIISAAHCFWNNMQKRLPAANFAVAVGKIYRPWDDPNDTGAQKSDVKDIRIPPRFQGSITNFQDDIALLTLETPITLTDLITPACLDFDYEFDELQLMQARKGRVAGWGLTSADGAASQVLNWAELPVVEIEQCIAQAQPGFVQSITSDKICAGFANGTAVCRGDSGGGLLIPDMVGDSFRYFLRGIVSTAPTDDHLCNVFAVATFTHIIKHERFIKNALEAVSPAESTRTTTQSSVTIGIPTDYEENNSDDLETPIPNPLTNLNSTKVNKDTNGKIETTTNFDDIIKDLRKIFKKIPGSIEKPNVIPCDDTNSCIQTETTTENDPIKELDKIFGNPEVVYCDLGPSETISACIQQGNTDDNKSTNSNDKPNSNIGLQVITEAPDSAPITNPPIFTNDGRFSTVNEPIVDNLNNQGEVELPNQGISNDKGLNQNNRNKGGANQGILNNGGINNGFPNKGQSINQENLNGGGRNKGGINQSGLNKGGTNVGGISQGGLAQQGNLNGGQQGQQLGAQNQIGIGQVNQDNGQVNQGGISGGLNQNLASQLGLNVGGIIQGASNEGDKVQGGLNQGLSSQLGLNVGVINQGDKVEGGLNQAFLNQAGLYVGVAQEQIMPGGIKQGGIVNEGLNQGFLGQSGITQESINGGVINQGGIPQTVTNQGGIIQGGINVGHNTYLPPKQTINPNINSQITAYPTLTPTVIPINVNPGNNLEIKPILTHPETSTGRIDVKTSVLEQYFVTTEPNFHDDYQPQVWQYNSPNYQHNHQNWHWQNWQQKQHDWQNWNSQWEHKQEYPHGYYHHTNKYGGHWWQKYRR